MSQKEVLDFCIQNKISFAIYKLPGSTKNNLLIAKKVEEIKSTDNFTGKNNGFVITPFSYRSGNVGLFLPADILVGEFGSYEELGALNINSSSSSIEELHYADFTSYEKQFNHLYQYIKKGEIQKAILSRVKHIPGVSIKNAASFYYLLSAKYLNACTFLYFTPQTGLWSGASPELLLQLEGDKAQTVSLAGTRGKDNMQSAWRNKEKDEQRIVTDFISGVLEKYKVKELQVKGPETVKAGKVSHLKTFYSFDRKSIQNKVWSLVQDLYPTPAVCGLPKEKAMEVVLESEKHNRSYYAGFIGSVCKEELSLYVNIRSMKFVGDGVDLYLGGGITIDSKVREEWEETELKSSTLQEVLLTLTGINKKDYNQEI